MLRRILCSQVPVKMAKGTRVHRRFVSRRCRSAPYTSPSCNCEVVDKDVHMKKYSKALDKEDWEDATCAVCLEYPHNAVLLLCSSHDKGCRPYMCATSYRYSNCLDQYEKAYKKVTSPHHEQSWHGSTDYSNVGSGDWPTQNCEGLELACPLCRGQVKGWTVVEGARKHLNKKRRTCMQENCSFIGTYKELRKHVKQDHPSARPREVDPVLEQEWKRLEHERERDDVISTITSSMPGAMVLGDYVIERNNHPFDTDDDEGVDEDDDSYQVGFGDGNILNMLYILQRAIGQNGNGTGRGRERGFFQPINGEGFHRGLSPAEASSEEDDDGPALRHRSRGRVVVGSGRAVTRRRRTRQ